VSQLTVFENEVLLERSQAHSFFFFSLILSFVLGIPDLEAISSF